MIKLDIQMFAKSAAYARESRKSKAKERFYEEAKKKESEPKEEPKQPKKNTKGEAVTSVRTNDQYVVYKRDPDTRKEVPVAIRTGKEVLEKMYYDKDRKSWISNAKGWKYIIRKKN